MKMAIAPSPSLPIDANGRSTVRQASRCGPRVLGDGGRPASRRSSHAERHQPFGDRHGDCRRMVLRAGSHDSDARLGVPVDLAGLDG